MQGRSSDTIFVDYCDSCSGRYLQHQKTYPLYINNQTKYAFAY
jgi:hypothetical protein